MISNERQFRITKAEAERFKEALAEFDKNPGDQEGVHPRLIQAQRDALQSQLDDLLHEIAEYEALKSGTVPSLMLGSFEELPDALIKSRIAAGLSQKALGERLGLKEQQIQRYESERYASASFQRMQDVAKAIGVHVRKEVLLPFVPANMEGVFTKLGQAGLEREFVLSRLLPSTDAAMADGSASKADDSHLAGKTASIVSRVFGWTPEALFQPTPLEPPRLAAASARFKVPAGRRGTTIYAAYAHYLAVVVLKASEKLPRRTIPIDPKVFRAAVIDSYGALTLESVLRFAWDLGVPVLPLKDKGTFHGACWRYDHRNVLVLKQNSRHLARWLFDLIHECFHAGQNPDAPTLEVIEADETSSERRNSGEEIAATQFAGEVALDGRADEIAEACVKAAQGSVERLKGVIPAVAQRHGVDTGLLANYMAFRLSWQGVNWWGAAANLQKRDSDPWVVARDIFLERFPFDVEAEIDRQLLQRAFQ